MGIVIVRVIMEFGIFEDIFETYFKQKFIL